MKLHFYINFDFGLRGDYKGLYKWLDKNNAEERGNGYALIRKYEFPEKELEGASGYKEKNQRLITYLRTEIKEFAEIGPSDRIYMTFVPLELGKLGGIFLFGKKQASPWEGHYLNGDEAVIDFE